MRPLGPAVRAGRRADGRDGQVIRKLASLVVRGRRRVWGCGGGGGVMPRGAEEGERGDAVRGRAPLLLIGNSREGAAPRGAALLGPWQ